LAKAQSDGVEPIYTGAMEQKRAFVAPRLIITSVVAATMLLTTLAGCAPSVPTESMSVLNGNGILTADLGNDVTARGVVLAAVLLVAGDVEKALTSNSGSDNDSEEEDPDDDSEGEDPDDEDESGDDEDN